MTSPPAPNAAVLLVILGRRVSEQIEAELRRLGLTQRHLSALGHVAAEGDISYSELARRSHVTVQSMKATVSGLEEVGAVEHVAESRQGKRAALAVTASGRRLLTKAKQRVSRVEADLLAELPEEQRAALVAALVRLLHGTPPAGGTQRRGSGPRRGGRKSGA